MMYRATTGFRWSVGLGLLLACSHALATPVPAEPVTSVAGDEDNLIFPTIQLNGNVNPGGVFTDALDPLDSFTEVSSTGDDVVTSSLNTSTGALDITIIPNAYGTEVLTYRARDSLGLTADWELRITLNPVNDEPSYTGGGNVTVAEDSGGYSQVWATAIDPGPNEGGQKVGFTLSNDNNALFSAQPAMDSAGNLTFVPASDASGSATVTVDAQDDGGTANGGDDTAPQQTFTISVTAVNDAPSFSPGGDDTVLEDNGPRTVVGWATAISPGAGNEGAQLLSFNVTGNTNPALFAAAPAIDPASGDLTYTPADDAFGSADITITLSDNGGTANGGDDTSPPETFTITVVQVNDAPSFSSGGNDTVLEDSGARTVVGWASALLAGPANESGQTLTFNVVGNSAPALFDVAPEVDASTGDLTYTPAPDAAGTATISLELMDDGGTSNGGVDTSPTESFDIVITGVNDAPTFSGGGDVSVLEDAGPQTVAGWASAISAGPADEATQTLTFTVTGNSNPGLFAAPPAIDPVSGDLTFTSAADAFGSADITVELGDSGGTADGGSDTSAPVTFTVTVDPVNDAPSFVNGGDVSALEDSGLQTFAAWATALSEGPANENTQTLTFNVVGNTDPSLFGTPPAVDGSTGDLTFALAADANGASTITLNVQDSGGTANGGIDTSANQTFTITVGAVNDAPTFTAGANVSVLEDAGPQTVPGWASAISPGPADESGQILTFTVTGNTNAALFSTAPAVDAASGDLTFESAPDAFGSATITLQLTDNGGTANGGADTSAPQDFTITVGPVNDAPGFTSGGDVTVLEDAGPQTVAGWATALSAGPPNESGQALTFNVVGNSNVALFSALPDVDPVSGDLTFTLTDNASGSATITLNVSDDGGTADGGVDTSADQTFTITATPVNDAPSFSSAGDVTVPEDAGPQLFPGWASSISAGPPDEAGQTLTFDVLGNTNPGLFATPPAVDPLTGDLTFEAVANANGNATITLQLSDDGGTADGGVDTSVTQSFVIAVADVNDEPSFTPGGDQTVLEDVGPVTVAGWATNLSAGPPNESAQTLTFNVVGNSNPGLFAAGPAVDGTTGDLTFTPVADGNGSASISINLSDDGGTLNGGDDTSPTVTFTIDVTAVNDAPTFSAGPNITVDEDSGPQSFAGWASGMSPGPADESGQILTFNVVGNTNPGLFSSPPVVDVSTGTLTFTSAADASGSATITLNLSDDGGTANGGADTSPDVTFEITISEVNDVPVAADDAATMAEDGAPITIAVLANDYLAEEPTVLVSAGVDGASESEPTTVLNQLGDPISLPNGQVNVVGNQVQYEPKADFYGEDFFTYTIRDSDGDVASGTVTVTVTPVNDPPVGLQERSYFVLENGSLTVDASTGLLVGAYDVDGAVLDPATGEPLGTNLTVQVVTFPPVGSLSIDQVDGTFQYTPPVNFTGEVLFEYRLSDGTTLSTGAAYRVRVVVLEAPEPPVPPTPGEVAIPFNLANVPLEQTTSVPPNVLVVMDDSGSMDWNLVVPGSGDDGGFELDNSFFAKGRQRVTSYVYLWDLRNNAFPPSSDSGRILPTEEALLAEETSQRWEPNQYGVWRARNHLHNSLYYNPGVQYTPWVGQDADNKPFTDANPSAIRLDPVDPTNLFDMLADHSYRSTQVPEWDRNGGTRNIDVTVYIPRYYTTPATPPLAWDDPHVLIEIRPGNGPFPGGPDREDCAADDGNPLDCTYAQEIQNFANYFQYYRSREYVTKNGIGKTIAEVQDVRVGYETISATTSEPVRDMNPLYTEGNKKLLMDNIYRVDSYGGTPLRQALGRAGQIFSCSSGGDCPALPAPEGFCQQNFALLFSDGYWNGGTGVTGNPDGDDDTVFDGGRYADDHRATLADVAMHYYETDLFPTYDDEVPVSSRDVAGAPEGTFPDVDAVMHQHMKTYSIAFGVSGTVEPDNVPGDPVVPFAWPDPFDGNREKIDDLLHTAVNGRGRFLNASTPQELQAAFEAAFQEFTQAASSTSSAAFNSTSLREGTLLYRGFYDLRDNTGELTATEVFGDGTLAPMPTWLASEQLDPILPNNRVIVTYDPATRTGAPFRHVALTPDQQTTLNASQVGYLRGVRTQEEPSGPLRERPQIGGLLGDIVNSSPVFVGEPRAVNRDQAPYPVDDLYSDFADAMAARTPVVYVGANDGMMHGFNALSGREVYAYVPNKIIDNSAAYSNKLDRFTSPFYQHRYYVDLTPRLNDVYMRASVSAVGKSWNSVLVGGLGAGGKGFFALNVTNPDGAYSSEVNAASTVLWEFTDRDDTYPVDATGTPLGGFVGAITDPTGAPVKDLGYALSLPTVAMSNVDDGGSPTEKEWVAIFGNGQNSTAGIAKLYVLFMDRGLNGWSAGDYVKLDTGYGVPLSPHPLTGYPNGLGTPALVDRDLNGTVDWVYAGDRLGNLFRFDISDPDPANWTTTRLFTASYDTGAGETVQPILAQPLVIKHPTEQGFLVIFGTGSYFTRDDADSQDIQSIYAIWDRGAVSPATALADSKSLRLVEQTITNVVDDSVFPAQTRRIVSANPVNYQLEGAEPGTYGWYIDLDMPRATTTLSGVANTDTSGLNPPGAQFPGEKAVRRLLFRDGTIITTTVLPSLDEFSCFGTRPGSIILFDAVTGGDAARPVVDFNTDGYVDAGDLVNVSGQAFAGGLLFNQEDLDGQLVDLSTLGGEGDTDFLFVSGGNETVSFRIDDVNDSRTGRLSWRELEGN